MSFTLIIKYKNLKIKNFLLTFQIELYFCLLRKLFFTIQRLKGRMEQTMKKTIFFHLFLLGALWLTACASSPAATVPIPSANPSTASQPASEGLFDTPTQEPVVTINPPQSESLTKKLAALTVADLAARLSLDANQITVLSTQPVTWPNSALGCPLPGKVYAQSRIPGFRITLQSAGTQYVYNTDQTGTVLFCAAPNSSADDVITPPIQPGDTLGGQIK